jgi:hypothetical protein
MGDQEAIDAFVESPRCRAGARSHGSTGALRGLRVLGASRGELSETPNDGEPACRRGTGTHEIVTSEFRQNYAVNRDFVVRR